MNVNKRNAARTNRASSCNLVLAISFSGAKEAGSNFKDILRYSTNIQINEGKTKIYSIL